MRKRLTIRSENGSASTKVHASNLNDDVFEVTADYVNISGFTVKGATGGWKDGIYLNAVDFCNISNNNASNNYCGIELNSSSNNTLANNNVNSNTGDGIYLNSSSDNNIENNNASNNYYGILLYSSSFSKLTNNNANLNTGDGLRMYSSSFNTLTNNNVNSNSWSGICLYSSSNNNKIYLNNFINNIDNVYSKDSTNIWNSTSEITYTYNGNTYSNYIGNYWSDYNGSESNGDGIGDSPYSMDSHRDYRPLMQPWENYFAPALLVLDTGACTYPQHTSGKTYDN